jgi:hypothetical protein
LARFGEKTAWDLVRQSPLPRAKGAPKKKKKEATESDVYLADGH